MSGWQDRFCKKCGSRLIYIFTSAECPSCDAPSQRILPKYYIHANDDTLPIPPARIVVQDNLLATYDYNSAVIYGRQLGAMYIVQFVLMAGHPKSFDDYPGWYDIRTCTIDILKAIQI